MNQHNAAITADSQPWGHTPSMQPRTVPPDASAVLAGREPVPATMVWFPYPSRGHRRTIAILTATSCAVAMGGAVFLLASPWNSISAVLAVASLVAVREASRMAGPRFREPGRHGLLLTPTHAILRAGSHTRVVDAAEVVGIERRPRAGGIVPALVLAASSGHGAFPCPEQGEAALARMTQWFAAQCVRESQPRALSLGPLDPDA